jgi:hypothetical protein
MALAILLSEQTGTKCSLRISVRWPIATTYGSFQAKMNAETRDRSFPTPAKAAAPANSILTMLLNKSSQISLF